MKWTHQDQARMFRAEGGMDDPFLELAYERQAGIRRLYPQIIGVVTQRIDKLDWLPGYGMDSYDVY